MTINTGNFRTKVLLAATVFISLAAILGVRLIAQTEAGDSKVGAPGPLTVPATAGFDVNLLEVPCWSCPQAKGWPVKFQTDLDLLETWFR